jgi:hypothetical protein
MIYEAPWSLPGASFAHLPIYGLEDLGFVPRAERPEPSLPSATPLPAADCRLTPIMAAGFPMHSVTYGI